MSGHKQETLMAESNNITTEDYENALLVVRKAITLCDIKGRECQHLETKIEIKRTVSKLEKAAKELLLEYYNVCDVLAETVCPDCGEELPHYDITCG